MFISGGGGQLINKIRIIGGKWRGRKISFSEESIRPTPSRVRETLFNWLAPNLQGARCLDLFAGTGALGLEALSRGAAHVTFVEKNKRALEDIQKTLLVLKAESCANLVYGDALHRLSFDTPPAPFDIVFVDPPFHHNLAEPICGALFKKTWVAEGGLVYVETERNLDVSAPSGWKIIRTGNTQQVTYRLLLVSPL